MPVPFTRSCSKHGLIRVKLYSRPEIMAWWNTCIVNDKKHPEKDCYIIENVNMQESLVITALWLRKVSDCLKDTFYHPKSGSLSLSFEGGLSRWIALNGDILDHVRYKEDAQGLLEKTDDLVARIRATKKFVSLAKDDLGIELFHSPRLPL